MPPPPPGSECDWYDIGSAVGPGVYTGATFASPAVVQSGCGGEGPEVALIWVAPRTSRYVFDTSGSDMDTVLSVHSGWGCQAPVLDCNDDYNEVESRVELTVQRGEVLTLVVDSFFAPGRFVLNINGSDWDTCPGEDLGDAVGGEAVRTAFPPVGAPLSSQCGGGGLAATYTWTAPFASEFVFDTVGSEFDTVLDIRTGCQGEVLDCNDDTFGVQSRVIAYLDAGQTIVLAVHSFDGYLQPGFGDPDLLVLNINPAARILPGGAPRGVP
jgi:hypothetical protein